MNTMDMKKRMVPETATRIDSYADLERLFSEYASDTRSRRIQPLVLGSPGVGKSRAAKAALEKIPHLFYDTHATPFGMYEQLYKNRDLPVVVDDIDSLTRDSRSTAFLKSLCNTDEVKTLRWVSKDSRIGDGADQIPATFETKSPVCIIGNEWRNANENVRAIADRFTSFLFEPSAQEVHAYAGRWFTDKAVYDFIGVCLEYIVSPSLRSYNAGSDLRMVYPDRWQPRLLEVLIAGLPNKARAVFEIVCDAQFKTEEERVVEFERRGLGCRATYFNQKRHLPSGIVGTCSKSVRLLDSQPYDMFAESNSPTDDAAPSGHGGTDVSKSPSAAA